MFPVGGEPVSPHQYLARVGLPGGVRRQGVVVLDDGRDGGGLAGRHLARLHEKHGPDPIFVLLVRLPGLDDVLGQGATFLGPTVDVQVNAEIEEGHGQKRSEELKSGGGEQEVPGEIKLGVALMRRNDASANDALPEHDGRAVEEEGQHPHRHHLQHSLPRHVPLRSVFNLCQRKRGECESQRCTAAAALVSFHAATAAAHMQTG